MIWRNKPNKNVLIRRYVFTCFIFRILHIFKHEWKIICNKTKVMLQHLLHRNLLASLSDSKRVKMSPSLTGPLTFRMICRFCSPMNSTLTWVHWPWEPVLPRTLMTRALITCLSMLIIQDLYEKLTSVIRMKIKMGNLMIDQNFVFLGTGWTSR